ncbi:hypothetical protein BDV93DRAFT_521061 [Ceratobasidium sp. AG-I]|nr:hypothetical protein BDV93DRAFT_521061 [Ceratobasidium sp. AG-I]
MGTQSLYQRCSYALTRLLRIDGMAAFFSLSNSGKPAPRRPRENTMQAWQSMDPVHQLWDLLALGVPLCILYNAQPGVEPLQLSTSCEEAERQLTNNKYAKQAAALFNMSVNGLIKSGDWKDLSEIFTISELFGNNINGFVKVVNTVLYILERLPESLFSPAPPGPPSISSHFSFIGQPGYPSTPGMNRLSLTSPSIRSNGFSLQANHSQETLADDTVRKMHIQHILDAERKYIADVEAMHNYAQKLVQQDILNADTVHHLFPGLGKLLDFGLRFLIQMEGVAECAWEDQRWGLLFTQNEKEFEVYEQYCANYVRASELMVEQEQKLMVLSHMINPKGELAMFLIKPIQKICKYHLQLHDLIKHADKSTYPHYPELEQGIAVAKRIVDQANETQRRVEYQSTVKMLEQRVVDWKGHHLPNFGELLLDDLFLVTKSEVDQEYHVFLFEKTLLCCKEVVPRDPQAGKAGKSKLLLLRKQSVAGGPLTPPLPLAPGGKKTTPLLLKGRVFLNNVIKTVPVQPSCSLEVWWRGDDDLEFFTLRCRTEEQLLKWQANISTLVKDGMARRATERAARARHHDRTLSTNLAAHPPVVRPPVTYLPTGGYATGRYATTLPPYPIQPLPPYSARTNIPSDPSRAGEHGYGKEPHPASGRATALELGRSHTPEREKEREFEGPRARTEGTDGTVVMQYRQHPPLLPPWPLGLPPLPVSPTNTQSPIAPFGGGAAVGRWMIPRSGESVRIKVYYKADLFQIIVPRDTMFNDLTSKVAYKVWLCGGNGQRDMPLQVKYKDGDGDMISLGSDDDVQMAFDGARAASRGVELWVS